MDELEVVGDDDEPENEYVTAGQRRHKRRIDHDVLEALLQRVSAELLKGERLIWVGRPIRALAMIPGLWGTAFGAAVFIGLSIILFPSVLALLAGNNVGRHLLILLLMGTPFYAASLGFILMPVWWGQQAARTCYALTNRRAIVWSRAWYGAVRVVSYAPDDLEEMRRADSWIYGCGAGDLIFHAAVPGQTFNHLGFLAIDRVADVEEIVRATLLDS